jgi:DNA-binding transcriptional ArsR family regulator
VSLPAVTKHLAVLERAGLLELLQRMRTALHISGGASVEHRLGDARLGSGEILANVLSCRAAREIVGVKPEACEGGSDEDHSA